MTSADNKRLIGYCDTHLVAEVLGDPRAGDPASVAAPANDHLGVAR